MLYIIYRGIENEHDYMDSDILLAYDSVKFMTIH